jgi:hypothetical protein
MASQVGGQVPGIAGDLIAGAPHAWFAGGIVVPGEPNRRCAGNKVGPAILRT